MNYLKFLQLSISLLYATAVCLYTLLKIMMMMLTIQQLEFYSILQSEKKQKVTL